MRAGHRVRSIAHRKSNPLGGTGPHIAGAQHARNRRLQGARCAFRQRPFPGYDDLRAGQQLARRGRDEYAAVTALHPRSFGSAVERPVGRAAFLGCGVQPDLRNEVLVQELSDQVRVDAVTGSACCNDH